MSIGAGWGGSPGRFGPGAPGLGAGWDDDDDGRVRLRMEAEIAERMRSRGSGRASRAHRVAVDRGERLGGRGNGVPSPPPAVRAVSRSRSPGSPAGWFDDASMPGAGSAEQTFRAASSIVRADAAGALQQLSQRVRQAEALRKEAQDTLKESQAELVSLRDQARSHQRDVTRLQRALQRAQRAGPDVQGSSPGASAGSGPPGSGRTDADRLAALLQRVREDQVRLDAERRRADEAEAALVAARGRASSGSAGAEADVRARIAAVEARAELLLSKARGAAKREQEALAALDAAEARGKEQEARAAALQALVEAGRREQQRAVGQRGSQDQARLRQGKEDLSRAQAALQRAEAALEEQRSRRSEAEASAGALAGEVEAVTARLRAAEARAAGAEAELERATDQSNADSAAAARAEEALASLRESSQLGARAAAEESAATAAAETAALRETVLRLRGAVRSEKERSQELRQQLDAATAAGTSTASVADLREAAAEARESAAAANQRASAAHASLQEALNQTREARREALEAEARRSALAEAVADVEEERDDALEDARRCRAELDGARRAAAARDQAAATADAARREAEAVVRSFEERGRSLRAELQAAQRAEAEAREEQRLAAGKHRAKSLASAEAIAAERRRWDQQLREAVETVGRAAAERVAALQARLDAVTGERTEAKEALARSNGFLSGMMRAGTPIDEGGGPSARGVRLGSGLEQAWPGAAAGHETSAAAADPTSSRPGMRWAAVSQQAGGLTETAGPRMRDADLRDSLPRPSRRARVRPHGDHEAGGRAIRPASAGRSTYGESHAAKQEPAAGPSPSQSQSRRPHAPPGLQRSRKPNFGVQSRPADPPSAPFSAAKGSREPVASTGAASATPSGRRLATYGHSSATRGAPASHSVRSPVLAARSGMGVVAPCPPRRADRRLSTSSAGRATSDPPPHRPSFRSSAAPGTDAARQRSVGPGGWASTAAGAGLRRRFHGPTASAPAPSSRASQTPTERSTSHRSGGGSPAPAESAAFLASVVDRLVAAERRESAASQRLAVLEAQGAGAHADASAQSAARSAWLALAEAESLVASAVQAVPRSRQASPAASPRQRRASRREEEGQQAHGQQRGERLPASPPLSYGASRRTGTSSSASGYLPEGVAAVVLAGAARSGEEREEDEGEVTILRGPADLDRELRWRASLAVAPTPPRPDIPRLRIQQPVITPPSVPAARVRSQSSAAATHQSRVRSPLARGQSARAPMTPGPRPSGRPPLATPGSGRGELTPREMLQRVQTWHPAHGRPRAASAASMASASASLARIPSGRGEAFRLSPARAGSVSAQANPSPSLSSPRGIALPPPAAHDMTMSSAASGDVSWSSLLDPGRGGPGSRAPGPAGRAAGGAVRERLALRLSDMLDE